MTDNAPEFEEVAAHQYRLAQARRFLRFCEEQGIDVADVSAEKVDLGSILDPEGRIRPEPIDYE
jgi:hypothetical protein